ncbi:CPBP family intramembrane glutamic endopeptidase [Brevibacillus brevis]|uniref:CPBP family intramembrane glutamic endopeptidase n=1 Tax=Brevibacillus brevis TaxID=1393 RepID=UPI001157F863|nr:type II CAAX endopeptidase family protein [Lysinibacillus sp. SDF0063]TQR36306.1 CPBP family intramembrane metalloprotease [Lysinibacillus sp. SDF0063]
MARKRTLLLLIVYGFAATLTIFYGLVEKHSVIITFFSFHVLVCICIPVIHGWWEGDLRKQWQSAWGSFEWQGTLYGLALGVLMLTGVLAGLWLLLQEPGRPEAVRAGMEAWGIKRRWIWFFSVYLIFINSLLEELFWRGFVLQRFRASLSRFLSIFLSGFFYSLYHLIISTLLFGLRNGLFITSLVFGVGLIWGWLKEMFPSIYPNWISHLLADLGLALAVVLWIY